MDEEEIDEMDHAMNMRELQYGFEQLRDEGDSSVEKRGQTQIKLTLNPGAFISKAINKGKANKIATYWTYKGSLTYPGKSWSQWIWKYKKQNKGVKIDLLS